MSSDTQLCNRRRIELAIRVISGVIWPLMYVGTVSYESTFITIGIVEIVSAVFLYRRAYITDIIRSLPYLFLAAVSSFLLFISDYSIFISGGVTGLIKGSVAFLVGIIVLHSILIFGDVFITDFKNRQKTVNVCIKRDKRAIVALFTFCCSAFIDLLYLFLCCFPGYITQDTVVQIMMMVTGEYDNHHPYWNTKLIEWIFMPVLKSTGNGNLGLALYCVCQIIIISLCVMYLAITIYESGVNSRFVYILVIIYCLMPYNIAFASSLAKDTPFAISMLLLSVAMYRRINAFPNKYVDSFLLFVGTVGGSIFRTNGKLAILALLIIGWAIFHKYIDRSFFIIVLVGFLFSVLINNVYISYLNIPQPDMVESLSIPLQQIARCSYDDKELTDVEEEFISQIGDYKEWGELYNSRCADNIKSNIRDNGKSDFVRDNVVEFLKCWMSIGMHNPYCYLKAWVDETRGYFAGSFYYSTWDNVFSEKIDMTAYGIYNTGHNKIACKIWDVWNGIFVHNRIHPLEMIMAVGIRCFIIFFAAIWAWKNNRKNASLSILPIAVWATLIIATPLNYEFRYAYMIFTTFSIVVFACLYTGVCQEKLGDI